MASRKPLFHIRKSAALLAAVLLAAGLGGCATAPPQAPTAPAVATAEPRLTPEEALAVLEVTLSPGDQIHITVFQHPELEKTVIVPPNGRINFPQVGEVLVAGRSVNAVRQALADGLASEQEQRIGSGDEVLIQVVRHEEFTTRAVVPSDGQVVIPIGGPVALAGKTIAEANAAVATQIAAYVVSPQVVTQIAKSSTPGRISNPQVSVEVLRFSGQKVYVVGEVARPGIFQMDGTTTLIEALAMAGWPTLDAEQKSVAVIHPVEGASRPEVTLVNLEDAMAGLAGGVGVPLRRGDIVYVPRSFIANVDRFFEHFYVIVRPIVDTTMGVWLWQNISDGPQRQNTTTINLDR